MERITMSHPAEPVSVIILDKKYQFACDPEQRSDLIEAARNLDERMTEIKDSGRLLSLERIALQAALNFSADLLRLQRQETQRKERIDDRIRSLADQIDVALKE
jgi:cell division protein ZapA